MPTGKVPVDFWLTRTHKSSPDDWLHAFLAILIVTSTTIASLLLRLLPASASGSLRARTVIGNVSVLTIDLSHYVPVAFILILNWDYPWRLFGDGCPAKPAASGGGSQASRT